MFWILFIVGCCLYLVWWSFGRKQSHLEPPERSGRLPIIGHAYKFLGDSTQILKSIFELSGECAEKGGLAVVYIGPRKVYGVTDPDDCLTIMNNCLQKHFFFDYLKPAFGEGLLTADVPTWKKNRKLLNRAFNQQVLDGYVDVFNSQAQKLVDQLNKEVGKPFDQEVPLRINNLETICATSFGFLAEGSEYNNVFKQYLLRLHRLFVMTNKRVLKFWLYSDFIYKMTGEKKRLDEEAKHLTALSESIIQKKKDERNNLSEMRTGKLKPFIDLILDIAEDTGCLTDKQIQWESDTIIAGGHDTTGTTLTFILAVLGSHPDVQNKACKEIRDVLGTSDKTISKEDLGKLVYIEAIIKEVLRLYDITAALPRTLDKDIKLKNYTLKANSECFILLHAMHRHSIWGPDADQFKPERWLDKDTLPDLKYYGSFGMGRRACIGKSYAIMMMKIFLTHVLRKYQISSVISEMTLKINLFIRPHSGHYITLSHRNM